MFHKLHLQMTLFCSAVTGAILIGLSAICLLFAGKAVIQTSYSAFLKELDSLLTNLQSQEYISHQWLSQMQQERHLTIFLYDNGEPLYYERLQENRQTDAVNAVMEKASWNIFQSKEGLSTLHEEFPIQSGSVRYYASAGYLTRGSGRISFVILCDRTQQSSQLIRLALVFLVADILTLILLICFSRRFTARMLRPLETAQKKQQQFVAAASHELRAPLAVILSGLESVEKADTQEEQRHFLTLIRQEGERMRHLISDMLMLASADANGLPVRMAALQPDELMLSVYEKYEPLALSKQISLQLALPNDDYLACPGDTERITQLLSILADNAISYTPAEGKILLLLSQTRERTVFAIADNGPSIANEDKSRIFERFYRADSAHTGHGHFGLGLCTAQQIAAAHKGRITVRDIQNCPFLPDDFSKETGVVFAFELRNSGPL